MGRLTGVFNGDIAGQNYLDLEFFRRGFRCDAYGAKLDERGRKNIESAAGENAKRGKKQFRKNFHGSYALLQDTPLSKRTPITRSASPCLFLNPNFVNSQNSVNSV